MYFAKTFGLQFLTAAMKQTPKEQQKYRYIPATR
jgi:hypothetical protein